jgi:WD40 repeat protein
VAIWRVSASSAPKLLGHVPGNVTDIAISPDATRLVTANLISEYGDLTPGLVRLWDLTDLSPKTPLKKPLARKRIHKEWIDDIAFSAGGKRLATASEDGSFALLDVSHDRLAVLGIRRKAHNGQTVGSVAFAPDGKTLASGGLDQQIVLWDIRNPARPVKFGRPFPPQPNSILVLAFSHDGKVLASGDGDGDVTLWDVEKRESLGSPLATSPNENPGDDESLYALAFAPGDRFLVAGGRHIPLVVWSSALWSADFETLRRDVCQIVHRDLTKNEWADFFADTPFEGKSRPTCSEGGKP